MLLYPLIILLSIKCVTGAEERITNINDFSSFVDNVNSGTSYSGATVYLDSDLSLSGFSSLNSIGTSFSYQFRGTFDGQGHVISNLRINSDSQYAGLFGYSTGMTTRNVIFDSTCSITSTYSGSNYLFVGGIIGYCYSSNDNSNIENCVNMGRVSFSGSTSNNIYIGGIAGHIESPSSYYNSVVKNCANYGSITKSGTNDHSYIGGIVGRSDGSNYVYIQNCLNHGIITHSDTSNYVYAGGIVGYSYYTYTENCVSSGNITIINTAHNNYYGGVVGAVSTYSYINYCYFTSDVAVSNLYGSGTMSCTTGSPTSYTTINSTLISDLNNQATSNGWNKWLLNSNNAPVTFKFNGNNGFSISSQIILLPDLSATGSNIFKGWFTNTYYSSYSTPQSVSSTTTLYGLYGIVVSVTFYGIDGNVFQETKYVTFGYSYGSLPTIVETRTGYTTGWFNASSGGTQITIETTVSTSSDHSLYARWTANNYTVTLNATGGSVSLESINATYDKTYEGLINATRTGYTFVGWFLNESSTEPVTNDTDVTIPYPHTLYARWRINSYTVTFDPDNGENVDIKMFEYNSTVVYPKDPEKRGYTFSGWDNDMLMFMPAENVTITAQWTPMNYTVTLYVSGGDELVNNKVKVTFNATYGVLPVPTREGYSFVGWFNDENEVVTNETIVNKIEDHTLYAQWKEIPVNQVEITFNTKDLSKEDVVSVIKQYTNDNFTIVGFEDTPDGVRVVVEFNDSGKAEEFVRIVRSTNDRTTKSLIKRVDFSSKIDASLSSSLMIYHILSFVIIVL